MKKSGLVLAAGLILGIAASIRAVAGDCGKGNSFTAMSELVSISGDSGKVATIISYISGADFRSEVYEGQGKDKKLLSTTITKAGFMYMLNPAQKTALKMPLNSPMAPAHKSEGKPQETSWAKVMEEQKKLGCKVEDRGKQKWEGAEYELWRVTNTKDKNYVDYYLDKSQTVKRFVGYDAKGKMQADTRIIKSETCKPIPKDALELPADYQIQEMPSIPAMPNFKGHTPE